MKTIFSPNRSKKLLCSDSELEENNTFMDNLPYTLLGFYSNETLMLQVVDIDIRIRTHYKKTKASN